MSREAELVCRLCGQEHRAVKLARGEKALCTRCDTVLATGKRFGPETAPVFSITGLIMAVPAAVLPFITAGKLGEVQISGLLTGVGAIWHHGMRSVATVVLLCGAVFPAVLLGALTALHAPPWLRLPPRVLAPLAAACRFLGHWAIPEVQVLAVLVALMKLGSVVTVTIGPGFWFYCAASLSLLFALHSLDQESPGRPPLNSGSASANRA